MRIDRLLAMTVLLLNRERISAAQLAERFEVSTKTVYRDMDALNQAGIPIVAHQGMAGGFEIMEQFTIRRPFLTLNEISTLVTAVKGMNTVIDDKMLETLLEKVQMLLHKADQASDESANMSMVLDFNLWGQSPAARDRMQVLRQAIAELRTVHIRYSSSNGLESERVIEPVTLIIKGYLWYVQAFCTLRNDYRIFRLSRIRELELLSMRFERRDPPALEQYKWEPEWSQELKRHVVLRFDSSVRCRVQDFFPLELIQVKSNGGMQVEGEFVVDEWFYGRLLSFGHHVKVEQPTEMAREVARRAQKIVEQYSNLDR